MTSHYVSQENDPGAALYQLQSAIETLHKFAAVRFYGDYELLAAAAFECTSLGKDLTEMAKEVNAIRAARQAAE